RLRAPFSFDDFFATYTSARRSRRADDRTRACGLRGRERFQALPHPRKFVYGEQSPMNGGVNIWQLVLDASLFVKIVMAILIVFSFLSWVIIFRKRALLSRAMRGADEFEE